MLHTPISSMAANARRPGRAVILSLLRAPASKSMIVLGSSSDDVNRSSHRGSVPGSRPWTGSDQGLCPMKLFLASNLQRAGGEDDGAGASLPFSRRDMVGGHVPNPLCLLMHAANARHPQSGYHFQLA